MEHTTHTTDQDLLYVLVDHLYHDLLLWDAVQDLCNTDPTPGNTRSITQIFTAPIRHELYITQIRGLSGLEGLFLVGIGGLSDVRNMHIPFLKQDR